MIKAFIHKHSQLSRIVFTFLIVILFILGRYLPLPNVPLGQYLAQKQSALNLAASVAGGSLSQIGLFSLGLGPWMYAMILVRLFGMGKQNNSVSKKRMEIRQNLLMVVIAVIQGLGIAFSLTYTSGQVNFLAMVAQSTLILVAGAFVLVWLGNQNAMYGVGGPTIIVLTNMLLSQDQTFPLFVKLWNKGHYVFVSFIVLWTLLAIYWISVSEKAEYRIKMQRVSINSQLAEEAYLPIKVNTSAGMPLMYAFTMLMLPQYLVMLLQNVYPKQDKLWQSITSALTTDNLIGVLIYILIIFLLGIAFSYVNLDIVNQTENLRKSGDFIDGIRPGKPTQAYLSRLVARLGFFSGLTLALVAGIPLLVGLGNAEHLLIANVSGIYIMMTGMLITIMDQMATSRLMKRYRGLFESDQ
ncbi:accessory Sec system protein translocase subunit SecY2 [Streptococcus sp. DD12]|uniref:accessory Sec system protein translocase subunit SecY2 n=1 Tax=Streptococcus sp. DD12 TaxID=1777880 RepID=UPI000791906E|nr:accessory Sec system protein translocase subunit SecY2 [Streptococcus sp. DD12]KXT76159.1 Preprotein translocase secY subunit [Streptococcus sp. DD12]